MSSNEESDDEAFESADEDISEDNCKQHGNQLNDNNIDLIINNTNISLNNEIEHKLSQIQENCEVNENKDSNLDEEKNELTKEIDKQLKIVENLSLNNEKPDVSQTETSINQLSVNTKESISSQIDSKSDDKNESIVENINENKSTEQTIIKGRKLLRKFDRIKTLEEETGVSDDKKTEVLNKLSNISVENNSVWNNWFNDIKSAAVSATSTTVSHASNWSLNPKSILTSAKTITSQVVDSMGSVVDSAIGAPPPEQMAAFHKKDEETQENENKESNDQQNSEKASNSSQFGLGFVDYTLNTLELIGKKTIGVIVEDKGKESKDNKQE